MKEMERWAENVPPLLSFTFGFYNFFSVTRGWVGGLGNKSFITCCWRDRPPSNGPIPSQLHF